MRYRLIPHPGTASDLVDRLSAALDTPKAYRVFHGAKSAYRTNKKFTLASFMAYLRNDLKLHQSEELKAILERAHMDFHEAMQLPVNFDMSKPRNSPSNKP